jgi:hypothetical protein
MHTMTATSASTPPKLPVWQTVRASYAIVGRNLRQLVRICWVWVLIMVPVYIALDWLAEIWPGDSGAQAAHRWLREIAAALPSPVDTPFLASIAVGWHRLILRGERVTQAAYVRLDGVVWRYVLYALAFLLLERGTLLITAFLAEYLAIDLDVSTSELLAAPTATAATMAIGLLVLPRLSLVMPAMALGERFSLRHAWRITRGNTLRLGAATALCMLPAVILAMLVPLLMVLVGGTLVARLLVAADCRAYVGHPVPLGARHPALAISRLRRFRRDRQSGSHHLRRHAVVANLPVLRRAERRRPSTLG